MSAAKVVPLRLIDALRASRIAQSCEIRCAQLTELVYDLEPRGLFDKSYSLLASGQCRSTGGKSLA